VEEVFNFGHKRSGLASVEIYETGRTTNNKGFEIQEWGGGGVLGRKAELIKEEAFPKPLKGVERKAQEKGGEMWKKITDEDI